MHRECDTRERHLMGTREEAGLCLCRHGMRHERRHVAGVSSLVWDTCGGGGRWELMARWGWRGRSGAVLVAQARRCRAVPCMRRGACELAWARDRDIWCVHVFRRSLVSSLTRSCTADAVLSDTRRTVHRCAGPSNLRQPSSHAIQDPRCRHGVSSVGQARPVPVPVPVG